MSARPRVGLLGGTFDPIHLGHLAVATAAARAVDLDVVRLIPSARPPHRTDSPRASEYHRLEMIRRAAAETPAGRPVRWEITDLELRRPGPSYTADTLDAARSEGLTASQIFFIIGADAFAEIATWHRYPDVLDAAHFAVLARPGTTFAEMRRRVPALTHRMIPPAALKDATAPSVILIEAATPDISSTEIRHRAARRESLDGLVTPGVAAYIAEHGLYRGRTSEAPPSTPDDPGGAPGH
jgi:nicotinate-nucleotide adenylyltransferase